MFWASTFTSEPPKASTVAAKAVNGAHTASSTPFPIGSRDSSRCTYSRASAVVLCIFQLPAMYCRRDPSGVIESLHSGQLLPLEQLERRAAAGRQVRDIVGEPELGQRRRRVAAADDGRPARAGHGLGH